MIFFAQSAAHGGKITQFHLFLYTRRPTYYNLLLVTVLRQHHFICFALHCAKRNFSGTKNLATSWCSSLLRSIYLILAGHLMPLSLGVCPKWKESNVRLQCNFVKWVGLSFLNCKKAQKEQHTTLYPFKKDNITQRPDYIFSTTINFRYSHWTSLLIHTAYIIFFLKRSLITLLLWYRWRASRSLRINRNLSGPMSLVSTIVCSWSQAGPVHQIPVCTVSKYINTSCYKKKSCVKQGNNQISTQLVTKAMCTYMSGVERSGRVLFVGAHEQNRIF